MKGLILSCCLMGIRGSETSSESAKGDEQDEGMPPILSAFVLIACVMFTLGILVGRCTCTVKHVVHVKSEPPHRLPPTEHSQSSDEKKGHQSRESAQLQHKTRVFSALVGACCISMRGVGIFVAPTFQASDCALIVSMLAGASRPRNLKGILSVD